MSYNIGVIECPDNPDHRLEPLVGDVWVCLDCGEVWEEKYPEEE